MADSKFYRRQPGLGWLLALLVIPALIALIGWAGTDRSANDPNSPCQACTRRPRSRRRPARRPRRRPPAMPAGGYAPFSIVRNGNVGDPAGAMGFTVSGEVPDEATKTSLIEALVTAMPGAKIVDELTVTPGVTVPDVAGLGGVFSAAIGIPGFGLNLAGDTMTLTGTAPSEELKAAAEAAAAATWPDVKIVNDIQVEAASAPTAPPPGPVSGTGPEWRLRDAAGRHHRAAADADQLQHRRLHVGAGLTAAGVPDRGQAEGLPRRQGGSRRIHRQHRHRCDQRASQRQSRESRCGRPRFGWGGRGRT